MVHLNSIRWSNYRHYEQGSYDLTISANDDNNLTITYQLTCDDPSVTIVQDGTDPSIFHVTYPRYFDNSVDVTYTATVTNTNSETDSKTDVRTALLIEDTDLYDITFNSDVFYGGNSYIMKVWVKDPNLLPYSYNVIVNNTDVKIEKDLLADNKFVVTFPKYTVDTDVIFTILTHNEKGHHKVFTHTVTVIKEPASVPSDVGILPLSFTNESNGEQEFRIIGVNPKDNVDISCDDVNVGISKSSKKFSITYPDYNVDTPITYTLTCKDILNNTRSVTQDKLVYDNSVPSITSVVWDKTTFYDNSSYMMTINASDPNGLPLTYSVECNNAIVDIIQDTINSNVFHITFPHYTTSAYFTFVVTVQNESSSVSQDINIFVYGTGNDTGVCCQGWSQANDGSGSAYFASESQMFCISILKDSISFGDLTYDIMTFATSNGSNERIFITDEGSTASYYSSFTIPGVINSFGTTGIPRSAVPVSNGILDRTVINGFQSDDISRMEYVTVSIPGDSILFGDLYNNHGNVRGMSNDLKNRGIFAGGAIPNVSNPPLNSELTDIMSYITITTLGNSVLFGTMAGRKEHMATMSNGINDRGLLPSGTIGDVSSWQDAGNYTNVIEYVTITTPGNGMSFGEIGVYNNGGSCTPGVSNKTRERGLIIGGYFLPHVNVIQYLTINTPGNSQMFGRLNIPKTAGSASDA